MRLLITIWERHSRPLGRRDEALAIFYQKAVDLDPNNVHYQNNLATALARDHRLDDAIEHYLAAIRDDPQFAPAYSNLGTALEERVVWMKRSRI